MAAGKTNFSSKVGDLKNYIKKYPNIFIDLGLNDDEIFNNIQKIIKLKSKSDFYKNREISSLVLTGNLELKSWTCSMIEF